MYTTYSTLFSISASPQKDPRSGCSTHPEVSVGECVRCWARSWMMTSQTCAPCAEPTLGHKLQPGQPFHLAEQTRLGSVEGLTKAMRGNTAHQVRAWIRKATLPLHSYSYYYLSCKIWKATNPTWSHTCRIKQSKMKVNDHWRFVAIIQKLMGI